MEDWVTIRNLKKHNPKLGTRAIAKLLGVSRNTVKRALKGEYYQNYQRKSTVSDELIPFYDFIKKFYLFKKYKISVIIKNLRSKGFRGSSSSIYRTLIYIVKTRFIDFVIGKLRKNHNDFRILLKQFYRTEAYYIKKSFFTYFKFRYYYKCHK